MEEYPYTIETFPKRWSLEITDENKELINIWLTTYLYRPGRDWNDVDDYPYVSDNGDSVAAQSVWAKTEAHISTAQFRKYVLDEKIEEEFIKPEDLSSLAQLLNNLI